MLHAPDRSHDLELPAERRRVGWSEWGAPRARPVLFCTGAGMTSAFGFGTDALASLGLRLVCVDRAGLGRSSPDPHKSLTSYASDVAAVLGAACGSTSPLPVVGFSQGAPFAIALAHAGLASSLTLVAGTDELAHPRVRPQIAPAIAGLLDAIAADPAAFEHDFAARADAAGLWSLVLSMSAPSDRAIYEAPDFAAAYRATLEDGFAQGPVGYVRDLVLASSPWSVRPEDVTVPVTLWYGRRDTSPVHSPDFGATLAQRFPRATRHVLEDEGGSLLWTRSREILGGVG